MLSNSKGAGFQAVAPDPKQLADAYQLAQGAGQQQQDFVTALQGNNGINNQTSVFGQQQGLANQLQGIGNGTGPNPALAQLNQATGVNTANQAALMAGQRGSGANTGLIARQAAMQGANNQQQAVGQGATLQAQQQLAALQQLQNQQSSMGNLANSQVNQLQAGLTGLNQNRLQEQANLMGLQANANSANAQIAGANTTGQQNMLGGIMGGLGSATGLIGGKGGGGTAGGAGSVTPTDSLQSTTDTANFMQTGAGGTAAGGADAWFAGGGKIPQYAPGGPVASDPLMQNVGVKDVATQDAPKIAGPQSNVGKMFNDQIEKAPPPESKTKNSDGTPAGMGGVGNVMGLAGKGLMSWGEHEALPYLGKMFQGLGAGAGAEMSTTASGFGGIAGGAADAAPAVGAGALEAAPAVAVAAKGGKVPALVSPGERILSPDQAKAVASGKVHPMATGMIVPGKPKVGGAKNSYENDFIRMDLPEGGVVNPRSVTQAKNPAKKELDFVQAVMAKHGKHLPKRAK